MKVRPDSHHNCYLSIMMMPTLEEPSIDGRLDIELGLASSGRGRRWRGPHGPNGSLKGPFEVLSRRVAPRGP